MNLWALRARMHAGVDPVTKKRHNLIEVAPPGAEGKARAEAIRERLFREIAGGRNPRAQWHAAA